MLKKNDARNSRRDGQEMLKVLANNELAARTLPMHDTHFINRESIGKA